MPLTLVSYCFVERGGPPPVCEVRDPIDPEVAEYFEAHVVDLLARAVRGTVPPARFLTDDARERFEHLASGTRPQFIHAAQELATRLFAEMQPTTAIRGFFVALRRENGENLEGIVLKLDASDVPAAALEATETGPELAAIANLLDIPGALQKGAVSPDARGGSEVVIGERWDNTTKYFLNALDVIQSLSEKASAYQLLKSVEMRAPAIVPRVLESIARRDEATDFATILTDPPLLEDPLLTEVLTELRNCPRPLIAISSEHVPAIRRVQADGIIVSGPALEFAEKVAWVRRRDLPGWQITVNVLDEPREKI